MSTNRPKQNAQLNQSSSRQTHMNGIIDSNFTSTSSVSSASSLRTVETYAGEPAEPEQAPQTPWPRIFSKLKAIPISSSEPRDVLQSERTLLTFVRFALSLNFTAIGMILNFKIETSNTNTSSGFDDTTFNRVISFVLVFLALCTLFISGWNYFRTVRKYSQHRIHTRATTNTLMIGCVSAAVLTLIGVNISLIIESYMQRK